MTKECLSSSVKKTIDFEWVVFYDISQSAKMFRRLKDTQTFTSLDNSQKTLAEGYRLLNSTLQKCIQASNSPEAKVVAWFLDQSNVTELRKALKEYAEWCAETYNSQAEKDAFTVLKNNPQLRIDHEGDKL